MSDQNKDNLLYFESPTMRGLYECLENWQHANHQRFLSISIHQDNAGFCCIALTNPVEVVITDTFGRNHADVTRTNGLQVFALSSAKNPYDE